MEVSSVPAGITTPPSKYSVCEQQLCDSVTGTPTRSMPKMKSRVLFGGIGFTTLAIMIIIMPISFGGEHNRLPTWADEEISSLVNFIMLFTDGKQWPTHKNSSFWQEAGIYIQQEARMPYCRPGILLIPMFCNSIHIQLIL